MNGNNYSIKMTKLQIENLYPYIIGMLASIVWLIVSPLFPEKDSLLSSTLTVSGIFVGFLATSKAILISMNSPIIDELKKTGYIHELVSYIGQAIWINLLFCTWNVIGYFVNTSVVWFSSIWIGIALCSLAAFYRVTNIMLKIFKHG